jgi:hypothetical protein
VGAAIAAASGALVLTGCTVPSGGVVGVTVDAQGNPVIVVQMCEGHIDGATMYKPDPDPDRMPPQDEIMGRWEVAAPVTGFSQFQLDTGGNGWAVVDTLVGRDPRTPYTIYGWSNDNSWSASHLSFSDRELDDLQPGTVLVPETEGDANKTESLADLKTKSCEDWC